MPRGNYNKTNWPTKLNVAIDARSLASYTAQIASNKNKFDTEKYGGEDIIRRLQSYSMQIFLDIFEANDWRVESREDYDSRLALQKRAAETISYKMLPLIEVAKHHFHLSTKRMLYWGRCYLQLRNDIRNWAKSDRKQYRKFL